MLPKPLCWLLFTLYLSIITFLLSAFLFLANVAFGRFYALFYFYRAILENLIFIPLYVLQMGGNQQTKRWQDNTMQKTRLAVGGGERRRDEEEKECSQGWWEWHSGWRRGWEKGTRETVLMRAPPSKEAPHFSPILPPFSSLNAYFSRFA